MTREVRDDANNLLARIKDEGNKLRLYDDAGRLLGYYEKDWDRTYTDSGKYVGKGNLLGMLIPRR